MKNVSIFLLFSILLSSCQISYRDRYLWVKENPSHDLIKTFEFGEDENIDSYCAFISDDNIVLAWESTQKVYLVSLPQNAEVLSIAADWALVRFSNNQVLTLIVDRNILSEQELQQLEDILNHEAEQIISGDDISPSEIEEHVGDKIWILKPDWSFDAPDFSIKEV